LREEYNVEKMRIKLETNRHEVCIFRYLTENEGIEDDGAVGVVSLIAC
jgi:hypothetical protein